MNKFYKNHVGMVNSKYWAILWIFTIVVIWIDLAFLFTSLAVIAILFQDIFIQNLIDFRIIDLAFLFGTIVTGIAYFIDTHGFCRVKNSSQNLKYEMKFSTGKSSSS